MKRCEIPQISCLVLLLAVLAMAWTGCSSPPEQPPRGVSPTPDAMQLAEFGEDGEVWIIARPERHPDGAGEKTTSPGEAMLLTDSGERLTLPVEYTGAHVMLGVDHADVDVHQRFENPHEATGEAVYRFTLTAAARVRQFEMRIGDRRIRGVIRDASEAESLYRQAARLGHRASLLSMDASGRFEQRISGLTPGSTLEVALRYREPATADEDQREVRLPGDLVKAVHHTAVDEQTFTIALREGLQLQAIETDSARTLALAADLTASSNPHQLTLDEPPDGEDLLLRYCVADPLAADTGIPSPPFGTDAQLDENEALITIDASGTDSRE